MGLRIRASCCGAHRVFTVQGCLGDLLNARYELMVTAVKRNGAILSLELSTTAKAVKCDSSSFN